MDLKDHEEAGIALVTTIRENFKGYTKKQVEGAIKAHYLQAMLGYPSKKDFKGMVHANLIANCPMTPENISHAHQPLVKTWQNLGEKQSAESQSKW